jgi:hypothetical protein
MTAQWTWTRQRHLGMNTPPIRIVRGLGEAARQQMLPPGSFPDQTEVPARPHAGKAPGYQVEAAPADTPADTRVGEMDQEGRGVAHQFEGPNGKVSPTTVENHSRALSRFLLAFCSGVAATLAWWLAIICLAPLRALTAPDAPDMIVPYSNQLDAMFGEPHTMRQSLDRVVAGQLPRDTDQTTTSVDQAPSTQADSIPVESRADAPLSQPTVPLNVKPTEAKALQTLSEKGKQLFAGNQHDASCFPSASAVLQNHPRGRPTWTMSAAGHEGTQCWYAAARPRVSGHRPRAVGITESRVSAPPARADSWGGGLP